MSSDSFDLQNSPAHKESLWISLWNLGWPVVALNLMSVVNTLLDRFFLGTLRPENLAAHGAATSMFFLLFSSAFSISIGIGAIVSRAYGAQDLEEVRLGSRQGIQISFWSGILLGVLGWIFSPYYAAAILPSKSPEVVGLTTSFLRAFSLGMPALAVIQAAASIFRSVGDSRRPMLLSGIQIVLHIVFNMLFIFETSPISWLHYRGFGYGLTGAGYAFSVSAAISAVAYLIQMRHTTVQVRSPLSFPDFAWVKRVFRIAIPSGVQAVLRVFSLAIFTLVLALVPNNEAAVASLSIGFAVESVLFAPAFGISAATGSLVGQKLGAKLPEEASRIGWMAGGVAFVLAAVSSTVVYLAAPYLAKTLTQNNEVYIPYVVDLISWLCYTEPLFCLAMVMVGGLQGAGDTKSSLWVSILSLWGVRVPLAAVLALGEGTWIIQNTIKLPFGADWGAHGAWVSMSITQGVQGILFAWLWYLGGWKRVKV